MPKKELKVNRKEKNKMEVEFKHIYKYLSL